MEVGLSMIMITYSTRGNEREIKLGYRSSVGLDHKVSLDKLWMSERKKTPYNKKKKNK